MVHHLGRPDLLLLFVAFLVAYQASAASSLLACSVKEHVSLGFRAPDGSSRYYHLRLSQTRGGGNDENSSRLSNVLPKQNETDQTFLEYLSNELFTGLPTKKGILESVRRISHIRRQNQKQDETSLEEPHLDDVELGNIIPVTSNFIDKISKYFALLVVFSTNLQVLGKILPHHSNLIEEVAAKVLSPETNTAVRRIRTIINGLEPEYGVIDVFSRYPPKDLVGAVLALSRLQHASNYYTATFLPQESSSFISEPQLVTPENNPQLISDLAHYSVFATVAYGWKGSMAVSGRFRVGNIQTLIQRTGMKENDLVYAEWRSATHRPAFFIVRDVNRKNIVLSIRGTLNAKDILTDLCATAEGFGAEIPCKDSKDTRNPGKISLFARIFGGKTPNVSNANCTSFRAHHGMIQGAREISEIAQEIMAKELESHPDYTLVLVGHSLGAGTAAVLGAMWNDVFPNLVVYGYGCPCVFPLEADARFRSYIISIVGMHDPFSTLSLGHLADISVALAQLCEDEELRRATDDRCAIKAQDMSKDDLLWAFNAMNSLRENMISEKLYPPGRILLISGPSQNGNDGKVQIQEVQQERFKEIILHPRLLDLSMHVPNRYEDELRVLWNSYQNGSTT